jgi:adenine-specific DNA-methyltransferase
MPSLDWIGKEAVIRHHKEVPFRLLEPDAELSVGTGDGNLIVQGDNLHALKALLPKYAGRVKCIYIDPPYNTGNEGWVYNDNSNAPEIKKWLGETVGREAEDLCRHDKWLCMMYPRLVLLKQFLREDGAIFISIDDNEVAQLRLLMDEIFGGSNFVANIIWQKRTSPDSRLNLGPAHDFIICFARRWTSLKDTLKKVPHSESRMAGYSNPDNDSRGKWASTDMTGQTGHATPDQFYEITTPTGVKYKPPKNRCWALAERTFISLVEDNRVWFGKDGNSRPRLKKFLSESEGTNAWTWWSNTEVGHNQEAAKELSGLIGDNFFDTPKPTRLIQRILQIASDKDSIILDSFAGSGTTGHAVLKQNAEDGGNRKFILVEMEEKIAREITAERIRRVSAGYTDAKGKAVPGLGGGFQFCRLSDEPLFNEFGDIREDVTFAQLADFVWFSETGLGYTGDGTSPLLGVHEGRGIYLLFNGILGDRRPQGGNILTRPVLDGLPGHDGPKIIYAAASRLGPAALQREQIVFKQTPYAIEV